MKHSIFSDLENLKSRPQITSEQHQQLMDQVNQMNILRESNSVLRDEKIRALEEKESANKTIKDLQLEIEPLRRKENEFSEELKKKDAEKKAVEESMTKLKATHEEQVREINILEYLITHFYSDQENLCFSCCSRSSQKDCRC